jgi:F-type H+-transporting ATPase subunit epsilon
VPFDLTIVTPQGPAYQGTVESVLLPGSEGDFGVLPSHERLLAPLRIGEVEIRAGGETIYASIGDGFAEVTGEQVVVLVDSSETAGDVDVARAELARDRAEQNLAALGDNGELERRAEYEAALERARNRIEVARRAGN